MENPKKEKVTKIFVWAPMIFFIGFLLFYLVAQQGLIIHSDSIVYLSAAKNIATRGQYLNFGAQNIDAWPPGTSILLSSIYSFSKNDHFWLPLFFSFWAAATILIVCVILYYISKKTYVAVVGSLTMLFFPPLWRSFFVGADIIFPSFMLLSLLFFGVALNENKKKYLLLSAILLAAALYIRNIALFIWPVFFLLLLLQRKTKLYEKIKNIVWYNGIVFILYLPWLWWVKENTGSYIARPFILTPTNFSLLADLCWAFISFGAIVVSKYLMLIVLLPLAYFFYKRKKEDQKELNYKNLFFLILFYIFFLWLSVQYIDRSLFGQLGRLLQPIFIIIFLLIVLQSYYFYANTNKTNTEKIIFASSLLFLAVTFSIESVVAIKTNQLIYNSNQALMRSLQSLPLNNYKIIYSNVPEYIAWVSNREGGVYELPAKIEHYSGKENIFLENHQNKMLKDLKENNAAIIFYQNTNYRPFYVGPAELDIIENIKIIRQSGSVSVYQTQ